MIIDVIIDVIYEKPLVIFSHIQSSYSTTINKNPIIDQPENSELNCCSFPVITFRTFCV